MTDKLRNMTTSRLKELELEGRAICTCCIHSKRRDCSPICSVPTTYQRIVAELERRKEA